MKTESKIGFAIIGCGLISKWHAEAITSIEGAYLAGAADINAADAQSFGEKYGCTVFENTDGLIESENVDVVCICVPSGLHAEYAIKAASKGKHFIVEKPLAITRAQLAEVIEACEKNHVKGCVISQLRFAPSVQKAKEASITQFRQAILLYLERLKIRCQMLTNLYSCRASIRIVVSK